MRTLITLALLFGQIGVQSVIMTGPQATGGGGLLNGWPMNEGSGTGPFLDTASSNPTTVAWSVGGGGSNTFGAVAGWPATPVTLVAGGWAGGGQNSGGSPNYVISTGAVAFSTCGWINASSLAPANSMVVSNENPNGTNNGWELGFLTNHLYFSLIDSAGGGTYLQTEQTGTVSTAANHQVCATYTGSGVAAGVTLYVDGSSVASAVNHDALSGSTASNYMGLGQRFNSIGSPQAGFNGTLGYVSVWSCVLTGGVISTNNAAGPSFTGLHC